jgi:ATP/maltotriose-dependent transcriptional regulator MalT
LPSPRSGPSLSCPQPSTQKLLASQPKSGRGIDKHKSINAAALLAEALYAQGHLEEVQWLTERAQATAVPDDIEVQVWWRAARAKLLASNGQSSAARLLIDEAEKLVSPTSCAVLQVQTHMAKAEVNRLAGEPGQAAASLRAALRICNGRNAAALADQASTALVSLTHHPGPDQL